MKIVVIGTLPYSLINFRGELLETLRSQGHSVVAMANNASKGEIEALQDLGVDYIDYPVSRSGLNPFGDLNTLFFLIGSFRRVKPDIVLSYTIKPIIWGGIAARFSKVNSFYAMVTGLGFSFQTGGVKRSILSFLVKSLYKFSVSKAKRVIFQNTDNMQTFVGEGIVDIARCSLVNGSGVNLTYFSPKPITFEPKFLLIARLLGDKGIREYVEASCKVKSKYPAAEFYLVGPEDPSPDGIPMSEVCSWRDKGVVKYMGSTRDVRQFIANTNIFVLPSYHEGTPRTVLEAMAIGRPILTTNVPGCKETVVNGVNGWLVEKQNVEQLIEKMIWYIENPSKWEKMASSGLKIVREKFDVHKVNDELIRILGLH